MADKETSPVEPPENADAKTDASGEKPRPAPTPARPHMVNDHDIDAVRKDKNQIDESSKK